MPKEKNWNLKSQVLSKCQSSKHNTDSRLLTGLKTKIKQTLGVGEKIKGNEIIYSYIYNSFIIRSNWKSKIYMLN